ncbi:MAG: ComEC/Rec2 family competence protein [Minisyncoccota bacterium]
MDFIRKHWRETILSILVFANLAVWIIVYEKRPSDILSIYFLDVGQGDSIFIDSPMHGRLLLDGGPNSKVLTELGKILPFGDRRIDVIIGSHPDADHISGLVDVINRYEVGAFLEPGVKSPNKVHLVLEKEIKDKNIPNVLARRGMIVDFGDGARLEILFPNQDVTNWETNDASIVAKLIYGDESFLLTGDSPKYSEYLLLALDPSILKSSVLKVGHHGSRNSTSFPFTEAVSPEYAIISAGKDNSYGHPHKDVLDILNKIGAEILSTIDLGTIEFETDGTGLVLK